LIDTSDVPVVILAGGKGFRMREITETIPKALVPVGPMPIILHVMHIYCRSGYRQFIICLGYNGDAIKEFFMNCQGRSPVLRIRLENNVRVVETAYGDLEEADVTLVDTGLDTNTGGRIERIERFIHAEAVRDRILYYCLTAIYVPDVE
jgi:glucose-1-phosphate cytidylyltransferase